MSLKEGYELLMNEGTEHEKVYDWTTAVKPYRDALTTALSIGDFLKAAEAQERIGLCYHRAAMQTGSLLEFRNRMQEAADAYGKAAVFFGKVDKPEKSADRYRCEAIAAYISSWLKPDRHSRKEWLDDCGKLGKEAIKLYEKSDNHLGLGKAFNELITCLIDRLNLEWDRPSREEILREALSYGEKAITLLSESREVSELARAYCTTGSHLHTAAVGFEPEEKTKFEQKALSYSKKALELSERIGDHSLSGMSNILLGSVLADFANNQIEARRHFEDALQCGIDTGDNYIIGRACYLLAHSTCWQMFAEQDPTRKRDEAKKCRDYSERAIRHFIVISRDDEVAASYYCHAENYSVLAMSAETNPERKRALLRKSIEKARKGFEYAQRSGSISATWFILHPLSKSMFYLATLENDAGEKKRLLQESLQYRKKNINALELAMPYYFWNHGVYHNYLALLQAQLANLEGEETRTELIEDAIKSAEDCVNLCIKSGTLSHEQYAALGRYHFDLGGIINQLYQTKGTHDLLRKMLNAFEGALKAYGMAGLPNRVAECYWQLATTHNRLQQYAESAKNFELGHENYVQVAEKTPSLKDFYHNHASYMKGWSEIEKARCHHQKQEYSEAKNHYEKAAELHESSKSWKYLAPNYLAWSRLEHGEELSRDERCQDAMQAFQRAARLFDHAKTSLDAAIPRIETSEEKEKATILSRASETRREYCLGRMLLEEARIYDRQNDMVQSAEKYGLAAAVFQKVAEALEEEVERKELYSITYFCQAWEKMKLAEQMVNPSLFTESSKLFMKAKECSTKERTSLLAMGNSALCKALEAGTMFEATRNLRHYSNAKRNMESAASYYLKAGFEKTSMWVNANQALLDAYVYMSKAEIETVHEKKIGQYQLAEKYLERSANLYKKAGYTGKTNEVLRVLANVKDKRQFALSLSGALRPPALTSSTTVFSAPTPTQEEAVGIERFEHANIQAHLSAPEEVTVGEEFGLRIDLANIAKESGLLVRIDELIPTGFEITKAPTPYIVEGRSLNAEGRQLSPHKVEPIRVFVQAIEAGLFQLCPAVVYVDEWGNFKKSKCQPIHVTVRPPADFQFKTINTQRVFDYLTKEFVTDYMKRRLELEKSGWRTFVQIKESANVPKSSLYGTVKHRGYVISELEKRGLVETRVFQGERGRGGRITKTRIYYDKETIKRYIDQRIMKIKEK